MTSPRQIANCFTCKLQNRIAQTNECTAYQMTEKLTAAAVWSATEETN